MDEQQMRARVEELDAEIAAYPYWGAALAAMAEERDGLAKRLGIPPIRRIRARGEGG